MEHKPDIHQVLRVFDRISRDGVRRDDGSWQLAGLTARADVDGYTVVIDDDLCRISVFFHNAYDLDFPDTIALEQFLDRLKAVDNKP